MFFVYQIFLSFLLLISPLIIFYRVIKKKEDRKRFIEKFSFPTKKKQSGKLIWFHGASVGEILSIIPIIKYYERKKNINQILITSSTLSSSKIINKFKFKKVIHQFYPVDYFFFTNNFLNYWKPKIAIFVESEIWPCMFKNISERKIPLILLNARLTKKTFKRWLNFKKFAKSVFQKITIAYPQNNETKHYLKQIGKINLNKIGNLKFCENYNEISNRIDKKLYLEFKKKKIWVASSTHKGEELFCAKAHVEIKKKFKKVITIIIPRHVHRSGEIISEIENLNLKVVSHSLKPKKLDNVDIYLVDTFGETDKFHKIGSSVFLGGSVIKRGGQNPLEAARQGARILHGPNTDNFRDVYKLLKSLGISKKINTHKQLASLVTFKSNKIKGSKIKFIGQKIIEKTQKELDYIINNEFKKT